MLAIGSYFRNSGRSPARQIAFLLVIIGAVYVGNAWTPSHYAQALRILGVDHQPTFGAAHPIRSDEYAVLTPYFQIAVANKFGSRNEISPYNEPLKAAWPLPIADWSLVFKPQLWGFWLLPPAYAYSLYFFILSSAFVLGYGILLRQLGSSRAIAGLGSLILFSSHFTQVWWTNNAGAFAFTAWPFILFLAARRAVWLAPAVFYAVAVWLLACLYPPFIIAAAFGLGFLVLAFRRDALRLARLAPAAFGAICAIGLVAFYFWDLIGVMRATVYPGARQSMGGGVHPLMMLAHLFPYLTTVRFAPLLPNSNECEVSVIASFLPLAFIVFTHHRSLLAYLRDNTLTFAIFWLGLILPLAWMLLPIPTNIGALLLLNYVPPTRMLWGFGIVLTLGLAVIAMRVEWRVSSLRVCIFAGLVLAAWAAKHALFQNIPRWDQRDWIILIPLATALLVSRWLPLPARDPRLLVLIPNSPRRHSRPSVDLIRCNPQSRFSIHRRARS